MVQNRRNVSAGTRGPNMGMSRSRYVRTNAVRHSKLAASVRARRLSGNPPRTQSRSIALRSRATSSIRTGVSSTNAMRPASDSED